MFSKSYRELGSYEEYLNRQFKAAFLAYEPKEQNILTDIIEQVFHINRSEFLQWVEGKNTQASSFVTLPPSGFTFTTQTGKKREVSRTEHADIRVKFASALANDYPLPRTATMNRSQLTKACVGNLNAVLIIECLLDSSWWGTFRTKLSLEQGELIWEYLPENFEGDEDVGTMDSDLFKEFWLS